MQTNRQEMIDTLDAMLPGLASGRSVVQNGDRFVFHEGRIFTFNDEVGVSHPTALEIEGAVAAEELYQLLRRHRAKSVDVSIVGTDLVVSTPNSRAGITMDEATTAFEEEIQFPEEWITLPGNFISSLTLASTTAGKDLSDLILTFVRVAGEQCWATNNIEIICVSMDSDVGEEGFMVPADVAKTLSSYEPVEYGMGNGWLHFRNQHDVTFSVRTVEAEYPDLEEYFVECDREVRITGDAGEALERLGVFAKENAGGKVDVASIKGGVKLEARGDAGWIKERVKADCPADVHFRLHVDVLKKALEKSAAFMLSDISIVIEAEGFRYTACLVQSDSEESEETQQPPAKAKGRRKAQEASGGSADAEGE